MLKSLSSIKDKAVPFLKSAKANVDVMLNNNFLEGLVAAAAFVIRSGGDEPGENQREKLQKVLVGHNKLKVFHIDDAYNRLLKYSEKLKSDSKIGKMAVLESVGKIKLKEVEGRLIIRAAILIASESTGELNESQHKAFFTLCDELGLPKELSIFS